MAKKNDILPFLLLGGVGLFVLSAGGKPSAKGSSGKAPDRGGSAPPPPRGGGSDEKPYIAQLSFLGYSANANVESALSQFQQDYNKYLDLVGGLKDPYSGYFEGSGERLDVDGEYGTKTGQALEAIIYALGFDKESWQQALGVYRGEGEISVTIEADPDDTYLTYYVSTHVHKGFTSPPLYDADPEFVKNKNPYYFKNGLTAADIVDLLQRFGRGEIGASDPIDSLPKNGGYLGVLWTGPMQYTKGDSGWEPHLHYVPITLSDINTLTKNKSVKIGSSQGFETEDRAREYHYHEVEIKTS